MGSQTFDTRIPSEPVIELTWKYVNIDNNTNNLYSSTQSHSKKRGRNLFLKHLLSDDGEKLQLYARSIGDKEEPNPNKWYKVRRITEGLTKKYKRKSKHQNMISLNLFFSVINDLSTHPDSQLQWLPNHMENIFSINKEQAHIFQQEVLARWQASALTVISAEQVWNKLDLSNDVDYSIHQDCKEVFNGKKTELQVCKVARLILTQLAALKVNRFEGGVKVASIPKPDIRESNHLQNVARTYHNRCSKGCKGIQEDWCSSNEVDMVGYDTVTNKTVLFELKTMNSDLLDEETLACYNCQLWLTWMMFSLTYPSIAEDTLGYLVIVRPGASHITILNCYRPTITRALREKFPWINCFCPQVFQCLTPNCVNKRVMRRGRKPKITDNRDLSYRNHLFNIYRDSLTVEDIALAGELQGQRDTRRLQPLAGNQALADLPNPT